MKVTFNWGLFIRTILFLATSALCIKFYVHNIITVLAYITLAFFLIKPQAAWYNELLNFMFVIIVLNFFILALLKFFPAKGSI